MAALDVPPAFCESISHQLSTLDVPNAVMGTTQIGTGQKYGNFDAFRIETKRSYLQSHILR